HNTPKRPSRPQFLSLFVSRIRGPRRSTLFPYTTLFRSSLLLERPVRPQVPARRPGGGRRHDRGRRRLGGGAAVRRADRPGRAARSEEHTSELQSRENLVCRLLLEKKK